MAWPSQDIQLRKHPCPCLYGIQIKVKKADNDLLIEQLREVFRVLAADKMPVTKLDKRLDDVTHKWDGVKKLQPQVKNDVEPVQVRGHCCPLGHNHETPLTRHHTMLAMSCLASTALLHAR
jgi:hypothetical protein